MNILKNQWPLTLENVCQAKDRDLPNDYMQQLVSQPLTSALHYMSI